MTTGLLLQAFGLTWLAVIAGPHVSYTSLLGPLVVAGVGVSLAIPAAQNSAVVSVADEDLGKAAGVNSLMRELGGVFGIAVAVAVFAGAGHYGSPQSFTDGFGPAMVSAALFALVGAGAAALLPRRRSGSTPALDPVPVLESEAVA
jgi:hypothetical protein